LIIDYHPGKVNIVADALSRKSSTPLASIQSYYLPTLVEIRAMGVQLNDGSDGSLLASFVVQPSLRDRIREAQIASADLKLEVLRIHAGEDTGYRVSDVGLVMFGNRICIPDDDELKRAILEEAHSSAYAMHLGSTKMYRTIRENYWWPSMKWEIAEYVAWCLTCQQIKAEHQKPSGMLQPLPIPEWK